ncbi:MAG: DUF1109 domain-containing protein [Pseudomonas sp.]|nr:DUF1109 domain-containing protein [Pseudomonas sp.]
MKKVNETLIDDLIEDLQPIRPVLARQGALWVTGATLVTIALVVLLLGVWEGVISATASPYFFITNGMLAALGGAAAWTVVRMANPQVGNSAGPALWSILLLAIIPASAVVTQTLHGQIEETITDVHGLACAIQGTAFATITATVLVIWLRRGAPVSLTAAGTLTGFAAGAIGTFAYGLACPIDTLPHLAIWHCIPVGFCALIGRMAIPKLIQW